MDDYVSNLLQQAQDNSYFRQVLETGEAMQVVIMSLQAGEEIGAEVHKDNEQVLICLAGTGKAVINGNEHGYLQGDMVLVRAGQEHNFINTGSDEMKIITIYAPPNHKDGIIHKTKAEADAEEKTG